MADCVHGDLLCPCQDGLACHYEWADNTPPMRCPHTPKKGACRCVRQRCAEGALVTHDKPTKDTGASVHDRREALARLLYERADLDACIELVRHEIAQQEEAES